MSSKFVKNCITTLFLIALSAPTWAQEIKRLSGDISANIGFNGLDGIDNKKHIEFGVAGGINLSKQAAVVVEYNYLPLGSVTYSGIKESANYQLFGGALRYSPVQFDRVIPYAVAGGGYARAGATASFEGMTGSASVNGGYLSFGWGASIYCGSNWGLRPEYRWDRQNYTYYGTSYHQNESRGTISVFYQWGGKAERNKLYSSSKTT